MIERAYGVDCRNGDVNQDVNGTLQAKPGGGVSLNTNIVVLIPCRTRDLCAGRSGSCAGPSSPRATKTLLWSFTKEGTPMDDVTYIVRRLTPMECERLQGYMDNWTRLDPITDMSDEDVEFWNAAIFEAEVLVGREEKFRPKTKEQLVAWYNRSFCNCDSKRYKAMGNSIALPQWRYVLERMAAYLPTGATLGSLFDGVGGFPLVWEEIHGTGTALWASEIELFPIAVTKYHFGEGSTKNEPGKNHPQGRRDGQEAPA